ncbi:MAG: hypothetical protein ACE5Q6_20870, partial [Dehalococcoidia bacterium]
MGLIIAAGSFLKGSEVRDNTEERLGQTLAGSNPNVWARATNRTFLQFFDLLYSGSSGRLKAITWSGLISSLIMLVLLRGALLVLGDTSLDSARLLLIAMGLAFGLSILSASLSGITSRVVIGIVSISGIGIVIGILIGIVSISGIRIGIVSGIIVVIGIIIVSGIVIFFGMIILFARVIGRSMSEMEIGGERIFDSYNESDNESDDVSVSDISSDIERYFLPVHPLKALASSLVFLSIVALIRIGDAGSFLQALNSEGFALSAFIAFNLFADAISLLETRWVLQKGAEAGVLQLLGWLGLDLILSAAIFLFLPLVLWEIPTFLEATLFRGDRPWLGILFWTTFSTSVLLYV